MSTRPSILSKLPSRSSTSIVVPSRPRQQLPNLQHTLHRFSSTQKAFSNPITPPAKSTSSKRTRNTLITLISLSPILYFLYHPKEPPLSPHTYSTQKVIETNPISPQHILLTIPVRPESIGLFKENTVRLDGSSLISNSNGSGEIIVQHIMVKSPDLQIERPYTPVNDVARDESIRLLIKKNKGGEVGRLIHSLKPGDDIGIRGPLTTFTLNPLDYDKIIMISTGTAIAPFLQLLSKISISPLIPTFHLLHSLPSKRKEDIAVSSNLLPSLQERLGSRLTVDRIPSGEVRRDDIQRALSNIQSQGIDTNPRILVLVCLPPMLMRPLCGTLTPNLQQGPITGLLKDLGLSNSQVWKLE